MEPRWSEIRGEFPSLANWTFLNTATFGQMPRRAVAAMNEHFARRDREACSDFMDWFDDMDRLKEPADAELLRGTLRQLIDAAQQMM